MRYPCLEPILAYAYKGSCLQLPYCFAVQHTVFGSPRNTAASMPWLVAPDEGEGILQIEFDFLVAIDEEEITLIGRKELELWLSCRPLQHYSTCWASRNITPWSSL